MAAQHIIAPSIKNSYDKNMTEVLQKIDKGVLTLTLNRPEKLNALSDSMMTTLQAAIIDADKNDAVRVVVVHGAGRGFCAGAAIDEMAKKSAKDLQTEQFITKNWEALAQCTKPTIAAVHGFAFGGGLELAMMADIIIATPDAKLALPEITLAVMPGAGGTARLSRLIPSQMARYHILTGERFSGEQAMAWGLVARVFADDAIMPAVEKIATTMAQYSRSALQSIKASLRDALELPLAQAIKNERQRFYNLFDSDEQKTAMEKFLQKK
ncbi:MAG: enoyl-CoA hydratase/isomerase family protein [Hydrotalea sp.]|nr:enoyl-CoA hydratase/isomerase family protein [Hydrotalea sp.]